MKHANAANVAKVGSRTPKLPHDKCTKTFTRSQVWRGLIVASKWQRQKQRQRQRQHNEQHFVGETLAWDRKSLNRTSNSFGATLAGRSPSVQMKARCTTDRAADSIGGNSLATAKKTMPHRCHIGRQSAFRVRNSPPERMSPRLRRESFDWKDTRQVHWVKSVFFHTKGCL